jgi:hypothetical protein
MKRNLMPLIAVAFIAAVAATGIFYGLLLPRLGKPGASGPSGEVVVTWRWRLRPLRGREAKGSRTGIWPPD